MLEEDIHDTNQTALVICAAASPDTFAIEVTGERRVRPFVDGIGVDWDDVCEEIARQRKLYTTLELQEQCVPW